MKYPFMLLLLMTLFMLVACAGEGDPSKVVQNYLQAKVDSNATELRSLICSSMEGDLAREVASFASVKASLPEVACTTGNTENGYTLVSCTGKIVALYGTENRDIPLSTYRTVKEDGEWKWCGEG